MAAHLHLLGPRVCRCYKPKSLWHS